jgi:hypothetical protein
LLPKLEGKGSIPISEFASPMNSFTPAGALAPRWRLTRSLA